MLRIPHAETNATMLPRTIEALIPRAGPQMTALARALGVKRADLPTRIDRARRRAAAALSSSAPTATRSTRRASAIMARPELQLTPDVARASARSAS